MKYVIVYAHPNPKSFNHAILERVEANLKENGCEVVVRDLYAMAFHPALEGADFAAFGLGHPPSDIAKEQGFIRSADALIFIHPIWWFGMPAILKGYIDRVFARGFAYDFTDTGLVGLLTGKKAIVINTTGGSAEDYERHGFNAALHCCPVKLRRAGAGYIQV